MIQKTNDFMAFMNLHDIFLNATLCHSNMLHAPIIKDAQAFTASDRGRFERMWITFLYVLIEAWSSPLMTGARSIISSSASVSKIDHLIREGKADGRLSKMRNVRDYTCHRDRREYWDAGRTDVAGQLDYHNKLYHAFSEAFLDTFEKLNKEKYIGQKWEGDNEKEISS